MLAHELLKLVIQLAFWDHRGAAVTSIVTCQFTQRRTKACDQTDSKRSVNHPRRTSYHEYRRGDDDGGVAEDADQEQPQVSGTPQATQFGVKARGQKHYQHAEHHR